mgnify:FL=1
MSWGYTVADVLNTTGVTVTTSELAQADEIITIYINRTPEASGGISARDLTWIGSAVKWQAAWVAAQPNLAGTSQYDSYSSDGLSVQTTAQWAKVLAPLAARALKNLSWKGSRSVDVPGPSVRRGGFAYNFGNEASDDYSQWSRL